MMLWKCCTQYASKSGKLSSGHRSGQDQFSFQSQRKAIPKNVQTTAQLHSSHTLAKWCSKPGFNSTWTMNLQMLKMDLEKAEEPEIKLLTSVQFSSVAQSCLTLWTPWIAARQASLSITNSRSWLKLMSIELVMPSMSSPSPPAPNPSQHQSLIQWVNSRRRWPKYWSFSFSISPSNEHPELISFRMDWLDLLAVQGTLKSLLQHYSSKAWIPWRSAFFTVQLSHPYMTIGKTIALPRWTFVGKVMSLLF